MEIQPKYYLLNNKTGQIHGSFDKLEDAEEREDFLSYNILKLNGMMEVFELGENGWASPYKDVSCSNISSTSIKKLHDSVVKDNAVVKPKYLVKTKRKDDDLYLPKVFSTLIKDKRKEPKSIWHYLWKLPILKDKGDKWTLP